MKKQSNPLPPTTREQGWCAVSLFELKKVFTEWDRRRREEPERFMSEAEIELENTPETYGDACASYFMKLIDEVKSGRIA